MKKKIIMSATAIAMALTMTTGAFAAPTPRESGNVDGNGAVNSNDATIIKSSQPDNVHIDNGTFDGYWNNIKYKMTGNGQKVMDYILTPENMTESVALRAYAASDSQTYGGYSLDFVANLLTGLKLDSTQKAWNGNYENYDAPLVNDDTNNPTIDAIIAKSCSMIDATNDSLQELGKFFSGVAFKGFGKNSGKDIYLTSDEGWGVFSVAMRDIVPISAEDFANSGYEGNIDEVFDGDFGVIDAPYNDISEIADPELQQRAEAFQEMKKIIVTNVAHSEGVNDTNLGKGRTATELYNLFKVAFPSDVTESEFAKTCDHFGEIYTRRYTITLGDKDGSETIDGNINGDNTTGPVRKMIDSGVYHYETARLQDVRNTFGDKIEISTAKDGGEKNWGFVIELYTAYDNK